MTWAWLAPVIAEAAGLGALSPLRRGLGGWGWAIGALPVGYVGWTLAACLASVLGRPLTLGMAAAGLAAFAIASACGTLALRGRASAREGDSVPRAPGLAHAVIALVATAVSSAGFGLAGRAFLTEDSFIDGAFGMWLADVGTLDGQLMSARHPLLPAVHAAERILGGQLAYVTFPAFAVVTVAMLALLLSRELNASPPRRRRLIVATVVGLMGSSPLWLFNSFYVHSHMISATYMLLAIGGIRLAVLAGDDGHAARSWLALAGLAVAGLVLARPDGIAYAAVPIVTFVAALARADMPPGGRVLAFLGTALATLWTAYGLVVARIGVWAAVPTPISARPGGAPVLALLALLALAAPAAAALARARGVRAFLRVGGRTRLIAAAGASALAIVVAATHPATAGAALYHAAGNLTVTGGWGAFWYAAAALAALGVASRSVLGGSERREYVSLAVWLFFVCGMAVHSSGHPGRFGWSDSFTRVAFHTVPLVFWYAALLAEDLLAVAYPAAAAPRAAATSAGRP